MRSSTIPIRLLALRWVALSALSVWVGGFTFYSAAVIPVLHDAIGTIETGAITRQVTDTLNATGVVAVTSWWILVGTELGIRRGRGFRLRVGLLLTSTLILLAQFQLHVVMDQRLDTQSLKHFYRLHRFYLIGSTIQWATNLGMLGASLWIWGTGTPPSIKPALSED
ncbi:MAG: hypothetical protein NVSMB9_03130 [Isosphaeraceae bacterium]